MSQTPPSLNLAGTHALRFLLLFGSVIVLIGGTVAAAMLLLGSPSLPASGPERTSLIMSSLLIWGATWLVAVLLWSMAAILRLQALQTQLNQSAKYHLEHLHTTVLQLQDRLSQSPAAAPVPAGTPWPTPATVPHPHSDTASSGEIPSPPGNGHRHGAPAEDTTSTNVQILEILRQLRDLSMMNEGQRSQYAHAQFEKRKEGMLKQIERAIATSHWHVAEELIRELQRILPDDPIGAELAARVSSEKASRLHQDIEAARIQLRHLMSITAWPQAEEIITGLQQRYPDATDVEVLADELRHERTTFEAENLQRLFMDLKDATDHRQWRRAMAAAEELIRRYPNDKKVEKLRVDLPTIQENADAQERRELEAQFKDLLQRQRYEEAQDIAKRLIAKYPLSPAAAELNKLLPKVQELIAQEKAKRQTQVSH
ncbi:MAG: hypothetical protein WCI73_08900 [Phycisphaerae bacterium]